MALCVNDIIARIGGEEFAAFLSEISAGELHALGLRLSAPLNVDINDPGKVVQLTLPIGAARRRKSSTIEHAFRCADVALYASKERGGARLIIWNETMQRHAA